VKNPDNLSCSGDPTRHRNPKKSYSTLLVLHKSKRIDARHFLADRLTPDVGVVSALVLSDFIEQVSVSMFR
jgi:hypothetical protein